MPPTEHQDGDHDGRELQHAEKSFMAAGVTSDPFGRLGHAEDGSQIDEQTADDESAAEAHQTALARARHRFPSPSQEHGEQDQEDEKAKDLNAETRQQDVVARVRAFGVALRRADQGGTRDLGDGGEDVTGDENPDDLPSAEPQRAHVLAQGGDERGERGVNGGGEKDGGDDDEEVLDHEVQHVVGVADGGRGGS